MAHNTVTRLRVTASGRQAGWVWMHNGGFVQNPENRFDAPWLYVAADQETLDRLVQDGFLESYETTATPM